MAADQPNPFSPEAPVPVVRPMLDRIRGRARPDLAYGAIEEMLFAWSPGEINPADIESVVARYGLTPAAGREVRLHVWTDALESFLADDVVTPAENRYLKLLQSALDLPDDAVEPSRLEAVAPQFRSALKEVIADGIITPEERARLAALATDLDIPEDKAREAVERTAQRLFDRIWSACASRGWLSEAGAVRVRDASAALGVSLTADQLRLVSAAEEHAEQERRRLARKAEQEAVRRREDERERRELKKLLSQVEHADQLPILGAPIPMRPDEVCHCAQPVAWHELAPDPMDRFAAKYIEPLDTGMLYITSARLFFDGKRMQAIVSADEIVGATAYLNAVKLRRSRDSDAYLMVAPKVRLELIVFVLCRVKGWSDLSRSSRHLR